MTTEFVAVAFGLSGFAGFDFELNACDLSIPVPPDVEMSEVSRLWNVSRLETWDCETEEEFDERIRGNWPVGFFILKKSSYETAMTAKNVIAKMSVDDKYAASLLREPSNEITMRLLQGLACRHVGSDPRRVNELMLESKEDLVRRLLRLNAQIATKITSVAVYQLMEVIFVAIQAFSLKASFTQLMSMWRTTMMRDEESIPPEHLDQPIGFWILTEENLKTALLLWGSESAGGNNRGITNEFTKRLCHHLASGIVGSSIERAEKLCSMDKLHLVANILKLENHLSG